MTQILKELGAIVLLAAAVVLIVIMIVMELDNPWWIVTGVKALLWWVLGIGEMPA